MSRRRRAALLIGIALVLGALAASDVSRREAAVQQRLGPLVPVVVARDALGAGAPLVPARLALREVPARFVPPGTFHAAAPLTGLRSATALAAGSFVTVNAVRDPGAAPAPGAPVRAGERVAEVVAHGSPALITPGSRVDVLVTRDGHAAEPGRTELALQDVEVLAASATSPGDGGGGSANDAAPGSRVSASLRVTLRQAVFLAAAQTFAREIRLLPRAPGDRGRVSAGLAEGG